MKVICNYVPRCNLILMSKRWYHSYIYMSQLLIAMNYFITIKKKHFHTNFFSVVHKMMRKCVQICKKKYFALIVV